VNTNELNLEKIVHCRNILSENYFKASLVEKAFNTIDYSENIHKNLDFLFLGRWYNNIPRIWFTDPSHHPDLVFTNIGEGIAFGEKKYVVEKILANDKVTTNTFENINYNHIKEALNDIALEIDVYPINQKYILFAPIKYFTILHIDWQREHRYSLIKDGELLVGSFQVKLFWSNKYLDYNEFILLEKSLCNWVAKPDVKNRLTVEIFESDRPEFMELKAQTFFNFTIYNPEKIRVLRPNQLPRT
jgi:hypothetical protein